MHARAGKGTTRETMVTRAAVVIALLAVAAGGPLSFAQSVPPVAGAGQDLDLAGIAPAV